jgi:hypothetical protein
MIGVPAGEEVAGELGWPEFERMKKMEASFGAKARVQVQTQAQTRRQAEARSRSRSRR